MPSLEQALCFWVLPALVVLLLSILLARSQGESPETLTGTEWAVFIGWSIFYPVGVMGLLLNYTCGVLDAFPDCFKALIEERRFSRGSKD